MVWNGQQRSVAHTSGRCLLRGRVGVARPGKLATGMTRQYVAGELSVLLGHLQAVTTSEASGREAWSLRHAAETKPVLALGPVAVRALALAESLCWDSLNGGDAGSFSRQAAVCAELHHFAVCSGLLDDD